MHSKLALPLLVALAGMSTQQQQYSINPKSVSPSERQYWCQSQETQCPLICLQLKGTKGQPRQNSCQWQTLNYSCICSNGVTPNTSEYTQTIPYFVCTQWGNRCVAACGQDNLCASRCRSQHPCGAQNPKQAKLTATGTTTSTPSATDSSPKGALTPTNNNLAPRGAPLPLTFDAGLASAASLSLVMGAVGAAFGLML